MPPAKSTASTEPQRQPSLETMLSKLETLVKRLESGSDTLAKAFELYEQAETLVTSAQEQLQTYETKLRIIDEQGKQSFKAMDTEKLSPNAERH